MFFHQPSSPEMFIVLAILDDKFDFVQFFLQNDMMFEEWLTDERILLFYGEVNVVHIHPINMGYYAQSKQINFTYYTHPVKKHGVLHLLSK